MKINIKNKIKTLNYCNSNRIIGCWCNKFVEEKKPSLFFFLIFRTVVILILGLCVCEGVFDRDIF